MAFTALAFSIVLWVVAGPAHLQTSISAYYHYASDGIGYGGGAARNIFVGVLWAIGAFLFFYKGYSTWENRVLDVAGVAALAISLFPMDWPADAARTTIGTVHYVSAAVFFVAIAIVSIFLSGETLEIMKDEGRKRRFARTYKALGALMMIVPAVILVIHLATRAENSFAILLIEIAGIYIFSAFWFVKSREIAILEKQ